MIPCPSCGTENPEDRVRCTSCKETLTLHGRRTVDHQTPPPENRETIPPPSVPVEGRPSRAMTRRSDQLGQRYELRSILGKGGMGVVYHAKDLELAEDIAVKLLRAEYTESADDVDRFKREIKTARKISHDNVVRIHDFGVAGDELFISMELLRGGTLYERLQMHDHGIDLEEGLQIALQVAEGLDAAHKKAIIHRDIKPHNVLFDNDGTVKLGDFGIARLSTATNHTVGVTGTPHYMSPETADGSEIGPRSDVYSFGVMLYEMFTGELPFRAESLVRLAVMHTQNTAVPPRKHRKEISVSLEQVILRCMEKRPEKRFANGGEVADALRAVRDGLPLAVPPERRPRRARAYGIAGAVLLLAGAGFWAARQWGESPAATMTPAPTSTLATSTLATPAKTATTKATRRVNTPRPTPTKPVAIDYGYVTVNAVPWVSVYIDGKRVTKETPLRKYKLPAGKHTFRFTKTKGQKAELRRTITIRANDTTEVMVHALEGRVELK